MPNRIEPNRIKDQPINSLHSVNALTGCHVRSSPLEVFLGKGVLKIYTKFTGEHPCQSVISCCNFAGIFCKIYAGTLNVSRYTYY